MVDQKKNIMEFNELTKKMEFKEKINILTKNEKVNISIIIKVRNYYVDFKILVSL